MMRVLLGVVLAAQPLTEKLAVVEKALSDIVTHSAGSADLVEPMVAEVRAALATKKESECAKVLAKFPEWRKQMTKRQEQLTSAGDSERTALLVSVLQNRAGQTVAEQMSVVQSTDFAGLPVVDFVVEHSDGKTPLVKLALQYLDTEDQSNATATATVQKAVTATNATARKAALPDSMLTAIIAQLEKSDEKAEHTVDMLKHHEQQLKKAFEDRNKVEKAGTGLNTGTGKFLERKELKKIAKRIAAEETQEKALHKAVEDIKHKDVKGLEEAQDALKASMAAMLNEQAAASGDFLKLLQTGATRQPTGSFSCPYCGAQCVEKCRNNEHKSYSACLTECIALNPVEGK